MRLVGFYRNAKQAFNSADKSALPSLLDQPVCEDHELVRTIAGYLRGGCQLGSKLGWSNDAFNPDIRTSLETMTDGEWIWPADAAYYCSEYGILPPDRDFIARVLSHHGDCPSPDKSAVEAIEDRWYR